MTEIECTYTVTFKTRSPFNEATYENRSIEEAVELEQEIDEEGILEMLSDGNYRDFNVEVDVKVLD